MKRRKQKERKRVKQRAQFRLGDVLSKEHIDELKGLLLIVLALSLAFCTLNFLDKRQAVSPLGLFGGLVGHAFHFTFGFSALFIPVFLLWFGLYLFFQKPINHLLFKGSLFVGVILSFSLAITALFDEYPLFFESKIPSPSKALPPGGFFAHTLYYDLPSYPLKGLLNSFGTLIFFGSLFFVSLSALTKIRLYIPFINLAKSSVSIIRAVWKKRPGLRTVFVSYGGSAAYGSQTETKQKRESLPIEPKLNPLKRPIFTREVEKAPLFKEPETIKKEELSQPREKRVFAPSCSDSYRLPSSNLLTTPPKTDTQNLRKDLKKQAEVLEETLKSFGIEAKVGMIHIGPTITSFEVIPAIGVKVQKIKALEPDIALNMQAKSIRIIAPIPGKAAVGIEVPNTKPKEVSFQDLINTYKSMKKKFHIPILIGESVSGEIIMNDLAKMPHCIIAGATGSGKSVFINAIVMSILMNASPDEIKLLMVDPKKVELTQYSKLPHMIAPVITEPRGACSAMMWLVKEMERRYDILKCVGLRNIEAFNARASNQDFEKSLDLEIPERLPYIVGIIDELADLMMVASSDIEAPIARIAQMARAVGIHLILATQRPSREVITGLIKANFPTRISFKVASRVNSQIVLDEVGAETLLGNGDLLFLPPGTSHIIRAQGAFIRDEDINKVIEHVCSQKPPRYLISSFDTLADGEIHPLQNESGKDKLFEECVKIVRQSKMASTTFLQRKLKIGYARAASLIDELEDCGIIGPHEPGKGRIVLCSETEENEESHVS